MAKASLLTQANLDDLLRWLDPDRERAGQRYERLRRALIKIFAARGCHQAEDLADETITRVSNKAAVLAKTYVGDHSLFFYGVAKNVYREYLKPRLSYDSRIEDRPRSYNMAVTRGDPEMTDDTRFECMMRCLQGLAPKDREVVTQYYEEEKHAKIESRRALAQRYGLTINALRVKASRLRRSLRRCVLECMAT
jgi:RNA polymerase sigma factor (sigma-70 family)